MTASAAILVSLAMSLLLSPAAQQPTWPLLVDSSPKLDTTRRVQLPSGRWLYRANTTLRFKESVSDSAKIGLPLDPVGEPQPAAAAPVRDSLSRLFHEQNSGLKDPVRTVIRDSSAWKDWWRRVTADHRQPVPVPPVDFRQEMVILAGLGSQRSTGYDVSVLSVQQIGASLRVRVRVLLPGPGCMVGWAETSPVDLIRVPRSAATVTFVDESNQQVC